MYGRSAELGHLAEEHLHLARGLVHINDFARLAAHTAPHVGDLARQENTLASPHPKWLVLQVSQVFHAVGPAHQKLKFTIDDVDPLILVRVEVTRSAASADQLENT